MDNVSEHVKEDWTSFQYASQLIQACGKHASINLITPHEPLMIIPGILQYTELKNVHSCAYSWKENPASFMKYVKSENTDNLATPNSRIAHK